MVVGLITTEPAGADGVRLPPRARRAHRPGERSWSPGTALPPAAGTAAGTAAGPDRSPAPVVLWCLPALYAHGLRDALAEAGHARVTTHDGDQPPTAPPGGRTAVVVAATDTLADPGSRTALEAMALVELVADAGVEAFTAAVRAGAAGVLDPATELEHAVEVVAAAADGLVLVPDHVARALTSGREPTHAPSVSDTERSWLRRLGSGGTVSALAADAAYSEREMYRLLRKLYTRLQAETRTEALLQAERWGLLDA